MMDMGEEYELRSRLKKPLVGFTGQSISISPALSEELDVLTLPGSAQTKQ